MLPVRSSRWTALASLVLIGLSASASAQQPSIVHVSGVVIDAQTDTPLRRARVVLGAASTRPSPVFTDNDGRFSIDAAAGATLRVAKAGYVEAAETVTKAAGTAPAEIHVALKRGAAITGRVVDETGGPIEGATVGARAVESSDRQHFATTDDLGEFRIGGLGEGELLVAALPGAVRPSPAPTQLGAEKDLAASLTTALANAPRLRVRAGDSVDAGDLVIRVASPPPPVAATPGRQPDGSGAVAGRVRDAAGRPLKRKVRLIAPGEDTLETTSNEQGGFLFEHVRPGAYFAAVFQGAKLVTYGQRVAGGAGMMIQVGEQNLVSGIDFVLTGGLAISGTVSDEYGDPIEGARVRVLQLRRVVDHMSAASINSMFVTTDDRGRFRLFGLLPGRYVVVADGESSLMLRGDATSTTGYVPVFYPNATNVAYALPVTLTAADVSGIDIAFRAEPAARISGSLGDSAGRPRRGLVGLRLNQRASPTMLEGRLAPTAADGTFLFETIAPGEYVVLATLPATDGRRSIELALNHVTVAGGESLTVALRTAPTSRIRGRLTVDGMPATRPPVISIGAVFDDFELAMTGTPGGLTLDGDGGFEATGVTGLRRFVVTSTFDGWYLKSARVRGVDALDVPFDFGGDGRDVDDIELVVSPMAASISGSVFSAGGDARTDYAVLLFAKDPAKWYRQSQALRLESPSQNGEFRFGGLPPGSYYLVAASGASDLVTSGSWQDPALLEILRSSATEISVNDADAKTVTLRMPAGQ